MLVTQRDRKSILVRRADGRVHVLASNPPGIWNAGETGLMAILVDRRFADNHRFYTCHGHSAHTSHDVRVLAWRTYAHLTKATRTEVLVDGMPSTSGRHGGCRLRFGPGGALSSPPVTPPTSRTRITSGRWEARCCG